ncbi:MFS transporter [Priestia filamentosa]|uniref:MFS transporter n=1 Tax=Priestia filamentosa TaxID=1402861 RepID=UPI0003061575|nr:MFS transporter [Priestia filamentosa]
MAVLKKVFGDVEVTKDLLLLLTVGALYSLAISLSNTFVNVYLWKQSGQFLDLALYNLAIVIFHPLTFVVAGKLAKKVDRVIVLRLGVSFLAVFYITVLLVGNNASSLLLLLGALLGIGYGFYWLAFDVLTFEITEPETRDFFNGFMGILNSFAGMIGPIVAGLIISSFIKMTGYKIIFFTSLFLFLSAVVLSFFLKRREAEGKYRFKEVLAERKKNRNWRLILYAHLFQGIREGTFIFIISVLVFITTNSELALGTFGLVNSAVAFVGYYLASRFIKRKHRYKSILAGGLLLYASVFLIIFKVTYVKLLCYAVCIAIGYPLLLVPYMSITFDVIGRAEGIKEKRIEFIVVRDVFLNMGRIISILLFIGAITFFDEKQSVPILLAIIGVGHATIYFFVRHVSLKPLEKIKEEEPSISKKTLNEGDGESPA